MLQPQHPALWHLLLAGLALRGSVLHRALCCAIIITIITQTVPLSIILLCALQGWLQEAPAHGRSGNGLCRCQR